jgi:hypothetical protein
VAGRLATFIFKARPVWYMKTTAAAVIAALLSFLIGNVWVFVNAEMFVRYFYEARMVALTHVFTLGWISLMIVGVLRQLAPVAFGLNFTQPDLLGYAVALWIPGLIAMVAGFTTLTYEPAAIGTSVLFAAIMLVVFVLLPAFRRIRWTAPHNHLFAALVYFVAAAVLGVWMGFAKGFDVPLPASFHRVLFAHIHLAGAGWAGMMILAVLSRLFPQPHLRQPLQARLRFAGFNIGLTGLTVGFVSGAEWYPVFGAILAAACIWYAIAFIPVLLEFHQPSDRSTAFLIASWVCLAFVAGIGLWFTIVSTTPTLFDLQLQFVYGFFYMFGWLSLMILGMLYRIVPTHISKFLSARGVTAGAGMRRAFINPDLQLGVLVCLLLGLVVSSLAIVTERVALFRFGWAIWLMGILGFVTGLFRLGQELLQILRSRRAT